MRAQGTSPSRLQRLPRDEDGHSRYFHPHGYVITQAHRDWNHDRVPGGYVGSNDPKWWWEVHPHAASCVSSARRLHPWAHRRRNLGDFVTLREARAWCDEHPREGWEPVTSPVSSLEHCPATQTIREEEEKHG